MPTLKEITNAVTDTLNVSPVVRAASQARGEIVEAPPPGDLPLLQVTWAGMAVSGITELDRATFKGKVRVPALTWYADVYCRQRSHMGEDMLSILTVCDAVYDILEAQTELPLFGLAGIQQFRWDAEPVTFEYGDPATRYAGIRFNLRLYVY